MNRCLTLNGQQVLADRHLDAHDDDACPGCEPCTEHHCPVCTRSHAESMCPTCLHRVRTDIATMAQLDTLLAYAVLSQGRRGDRRESLPLGGEPMVTIGPLAPLALDDREDPEPPHVTILSWWEHAVRKGLGHLSAPRPSLHACLVYLDRWLTDAATIPGLDVRAFAGAVAGARIHLEDVLSAGLRDEPGVPCLRCGTTLLRECHPQTGLADHWTCRGCHARLTAAEYWLSVRQAYAERAPFQTAEQIAARLDVDAQRVRVWGSRGQVRKGPRDATTGLTTYSVEDVQRRCEEATA